ncbi:MAG: hypothetical protein HY717_03405 [Planctomycetes bacterium]|nr:hypothetical protein [Planctomycetota bacterium]
MNGEGPGGSAPAAEPGLGKAVTAACLHHGPRGEEFLYRRLLAAAGGGSRRTRNCGMAAAGPVPSQAVNPGPHFEADLGDARQLLQTQLKIRQGRDGLPPEGEPDERISFNLEESKVNAWQYSQRSRELE